MLSDLQSVYAKLIEAAADWLDLGLALELGHGTLKDIKDDYHRNKDCLREMLAARLKTGPLTYSDICQSLRAPTVKRNDVAEAIEKEFTGIYYKLCARMMSLASVTYYLLHYSTSSQCSSVIKVDSLVYTYTG